MLSPAPSTSTFVRAGLMPACASLSRMIAPDVRAICVALGPQSTSVADAMKSVLVGDRDFQRFGCRGSARSAHLNAIRSVFQQPHVGKIGVDVGRQVVGRIADLVDELLGHGLHRHAAPAARGLGDREAAVVADFGDRIPHVGQADFGPPGGKHAARALGAALDQMPCHRGRREPVPVAPVPAEFVDCRPQRERSVGNATGNHDPRPTVERLDDSRRTEIGVRAHDAIANRVDRFARLKMGERLARPWRVHRAAERDRRPSPFRS